MARGGLGARKSLEERIARSTRYHLIGVPAGSPVAEVNNVLRRWEWGSRLGVILRNSGSTVTIQWEDEDEFSFYSGEDARYKVDTNLWRIGQAPQQSPLTALAGSKGKGRPALTSSPAADSIMTSPQCDEPLTKEHDMTQIADAIDKMKVAELRAEAKKYFDDSEIKGLKKAELVELLKENLTDDDIEEEDDSPESAPSADSPESPESADSADSPDETDDEEPAPAPKQDHKERDTYTAKQVATRIGTDAKTLRKYFRSPASTFEPVGQGGRYEFDAADLPGIQKEFEQWMSDKAARSTPRKKREPEPIRETVAEEEDEDIELEDDPDDNFEPTEDELDELMDDIEEED